MPGPPRIVYLDVDDEITSAATRIRTADASRVAIVVPPGSRVSTSRINFRLLAREALASGRQLSIVAPDAASRSLAAAAGLDVYRTVGEFETADAESATSTGDGAGSVGSAAGGAATAATLAGAAGSRAGGSKGAAPSPTATGGGPGPSSDATAASPQRTPRPGPAAAVVAPGIAESAASSPAADDLRARSNVAGVRAVAPPAHEWPIRRMLLGAGAVLVIAALVVGAVAAYLLLPQASIVVVPRVDPVGPIETSITADPGATTTDIANAIVPAQNVSFPVAAKGTFKATGQNVTETKATGTVTFTNLNTSLLDGDVRIPAGTRVSTQTGVVFQTTSDVVVPRADFLTQTPGHADAPVVALLAGPAGNVPAGSLTRLPSDVIVRLSNQNDPVTNQQPTTGGTRTVTPKVVQKDVDAAVSSLQKQLGETFKGQMAAGTNVPSGLTLFPETGALGTATLNPDPASLVGQQVAQFTLAASATGTATAVDEQPVTSVAEARLRAQVPAGYDLVAGSVNVQIGTPAVNGALVTFPTTSTASQVQRLDPAKLEAEVRGLPVDKAKQALEKYGTVTITTWPDWVSSIPTYDFRVDLTVRPSASVEPTSPGPSSAGGSSASPPASSPSASPASPSPS